MNELLNNHEYKNWLIDLKSKIKQSQIKAALAVNSQLIQLYWDLGKQIVEKQEHAKWGSGFIDQLSKDLQAEFPAMGGFSVSNLRYCRQFYLFYSQFLIHQQVVGELESGEFKNTKQVVSQLQSPDNQLVTKGGQLAPKLENQLFNIPWGHHILIIQKIKNQQEALFYVKETIEVGRF